ncbi:MAG TPA: XisI protein [Cyanobacteria bacterium UBA11369]|nr:XisI protein [Cyanobacteria bacterium UBA11371]HBE33973.1 XisI protein [Cyanobacteria bacterium UBA11368]HBE47745.1 XisI protein [Cyanobacteria bacterium UBA11369]
MEKLNYRELVKKVIEKHASDRSQADASNAQIVFDTERDRYLLLYVGWRDEERLHGCPIHIDIQDGKIWIQRDFTEEGIANELAQMGVPKTDIVLGFRSPYVRQFTEFAVS